MPALSFFCLLSAWLLWEDPKRTIVAYLPGAAIVPAAALGTNYLAHGTFIPAYAQREGEKTGTNTQYAKGRQGSGDSYWTNPEKRSPVDQGEPSRAVYAFHALIGHHGIFSLTPVWLLRLVGLAMLCLRRSWAGELGWFILILSAVCITFYLLRPLDDRNYGGMTSGFRWVFWFAPLWLVAMLPAADWMASRAACGCWPVGCLPLRDVCQLSDLEPLGPTLAGGSAAGTALGANGRAVVRESRNCRVLCEHHFFIFAIRADIHQSVAQRLSEGAHRAPYDPDFARSPYEAAAAAGCLSPRAFLACSTIAAKPAASATAISASVLRSSTMPALVSPAINWL